MPTAGPLAAGGGYQRGGALSSFNSNCTHVSGATAGKQPQRTKKLEGKYLDSCTKGLPTMNHGYEVIHTNDLAEASNEIVHDWDEAVQIATDYFAEGHPAHIRYNQVTVWVAGVEAPPPDPRGPLTETA